MECMRTAMFRFQRAIFPGITATSYDAVWSEDEFDLGAAVGGNFYITLDSNYTLQGFIPEGFKNIDVYGIQLSGDIEPRVQTSAYAPGTSVLNWNAKIEIEGTYPILGGSYESNVGPVFNVYQMGSPPQDTFTLTGSNGLLNFYSPIKSVKRISLTGVSLSAKGQNLIQQQFVANLNLLVNYKYEGE